jgi:3-polyprenyl-4-hydroxybenzoate decarboxylase
MEKCRFCHKISAKVPGAGKRAIYAQWTTYDQLEFQYIVAYVPTDYLRQPTQQEIWDALAQHINSQKSTTRIMLQCDANTQPTRYVEGVTSKWCLRKSKSDLIPKKRQASERMDVFMRDTEPFLTSSADCAKGNRRGAPVRRRQRRE